MKRLHNYAATDASRTLDRLFELAVLLAEHMERALAERGLTRARATVVWELHHRGPLTQRQVSQALRVTPRNVTGLVDALELGGFVARAPHPTDRRATLVTLTGHGRVVAAALRADHEDFAADLFAAVSPSQIAGFGTTLDHVLELLREVRPVPP